MGQILVLAVGLLFYLLVGAGFGFAAYRLAARQASLLAALNDRLNAALRDLVRLTAELHRLQAAQLESTAAPAPIVQAGAVPVADSVLPVVALTAPAADTPGETSPWNGEPLPWQHSTG